MTTKVADNCCPIFVRLPEMAALIGIAERTLRTWAIRRLVPSYAPTKRLLLFKPNEVEKAIAKFKRE